MGKVITLDAVPSYVDTKAKREKEKASEAQASGALDKLKAKKFSQLSAKDKDDLLMILAMRAGLVFPE